MQRLLDSLILMFVDVLIKRIGLDSILISVVNIQPGDFIVVKSQRAISEGGWENLKAQLQPLFPNNKVIVLEDTLDLFVMRGGWDKARGK